MRRRPRCASRFVAAFCADRSTGPRRSTASGVAVSAVLVGLLVVSGCSDGGPVSPIADIAEATVVAEPSATAEPTVAPTVTPAATPTQVPTPAPTPDPLLLQAEAIALEHSVLVNELFSDPRNMDLSRMIALEAGPEPRQPMTDWALRSVSNLLEANHYLPNDDVRHEVIGSQWDPANTGRLAWVDLCSQTGGEWFDLDTGELSMTSHPDPFVTRYKILTDSMQVAAIAEQFDGEFLACELA